MESYRRKIQAFRRNKPESDRETCEQSDQDHYSLGTDPEFPTPNLLIQLAYRLLGILTTCRVSKQKPRKPSVPRIATRPRQHGSKQSRSPQYGSSSTTTLDHGLSSSSFPDPGSSTVHCCPIVSIKQSTDQTHRYTVLQVPVV